MHQPAVLARQPRRLNGAEGLRVELDRIGGSGAH
jgi:hypothetical protein